MKNKYNEDIRLIKYEEFKYKIGIIQPNGDHSIVGNFYSPREAIECLAYNGFITLPKSKPSVFDKLVSGLSSFFAHSSKIDNKILD